VVSAVQHGFVKARSCLTNLLESLEQWTAAEWTFYLDYRKAFDSVPHKRPIYKLSTVGFHGKLLSWLSSFLSDSLRQDNESWSPWQLFNLVSDV